MFTSIEDAIYQQHSASRALFALSQLLEDQHRIHPGLTDLTLAIAEKVERHAHDAQAGLQALRPLIA